MEKYRTFADATTGIHPFMPVWAGAGRSLSTRSWARRGLSGVGWGLRVVFGGALAGARLLLLLVCVAPLLLLAALAEVVVPFALLRRTACAAAEAAAARLALFILGFVLLREQPADCRRVKIRCPTNLDRFQKLPPPSLAGGGVVLCNLTSFVEILYAAARLTRPTFAVAHSDGSFSRLSFLKTIQFASNMKPLAGRGAYTSLVSLLAGSAAARFDSVVIYPEGMKSNGRCILSWKVEGLVREPKAFLALVKSPKPKLSILGLHLLEGRRRFDFPRPLLRAAPHCKTRAKRGAA
eukprot:GHVT01038665.1.p1 GENE.GHVT01038665.1~~GHVT01038665.1.p1  ORF type:complete len:294 (+),score=49.02 GHVT01038665.1:383-1264(+)